MKKEEVIHRFCSLATKVADLHFVPKKASDCFCPNDETENDPRYSFDEEVIQFIEKAVLKEITSQVRRAAQDRIDTNKCNSSRNIF